MISWSYKVSRSSSVEDVDQDNVAKLRLRPTHPDWWGPMVVFWSWKLLMLKESSGFLLCPELLRLSPKLL